MIFSTWVAISYASFFSHIKYQKKTTSNPSLSSIVTDFHSLYPYNLSTLNSNFITSVLDFPLYAINYVNTFAGETGHASTDKNNTYLSNKYIKNH